MCVVWRVWDFVTSRLRANVLAFPREAVHYGKIDVHSRELSSQSVFACVDSAWALRSKWQCNTGNPETPNKSEDFLLDLHGSYGTVHRSVRRRLVLCFALMSIADSYVCMADACTSGSTCVNSVWALRRKWHCNIGNPETPNKTEDLLLESHGSHCTIHRIVRRRSVLFLPYVSFQPNCSRECSPTSTSANTSTESSMQMRTLRQNTP